MISGIWTISIWTTGSKTIGKPTNGPKLTTTKEFSNKWKTSFQTTRLRDSLFKMFRDALEENNETSSSANFCILWQDQFVNEASKARNFFSPLYALPLLLCGGRFVTCDWRVSRTAIRVWESPYSLVKLDFLPIEHVFNNWSSIPRSLDNNNILALCQWTF